MLVADDSAFMRRAIERLLAEDEGITIVGFATDGIEAVHRTLELRPDVITMDVEMPRLDGVGAVREVMRVLPTPILVLSTKTTSGAAATIEALEAGAVDCLAKSGPLSEDLSGLGTRLRRAVRAASTVKVRRRRVDVPPKERQRAQTEPRSGRGNPARHILVVGASTGGPPALARLVPGFPRDLQAAVLVVQHMPAGFTAALARRLDGISELGVAEVEDGEMLMEGRVYVAPGGIHTVVDGHGRLRLNGGPPLHGVRPSIDVTLDSVTGAFGSRAAVAILTGMGRDGAAGAARLEAAGGRVFVQDADSSLIRGMPAATKMLAANAMEASLEQLPGLLVGHLFQ